MASCVFCDIVKGEQEARIVLETDSMLAFLDSRPLFAGHTLLIPRQHYETMPDMPVDLAGPYFNQAQRLALAMETGLEAAGSFVAVNNRVSQSVPHLHIHVVPRNRKDGLRGFFWPRRKYENADEAADIAQRLRETLSVDGWNVPE